MRFPSEAGFYELNKFPGCNQIVVSNHAFIYEHMRGKGLGQLQHGERLDKAQELGYDYMLATAVSTNEVEKHILAKNGWKKLDEFRSTETGRVVELWGRLVGEMTHTHIQPLYSLSGTQPQEKSA